MLCTLRFLCVAEYMAGLRHVWFVPQAKEGEGASGSDGEDAEDPAGSDGEDGDEPALTAEEKVVKEMEALREREVAEARRTRKKRRELKRKAKIRLAQSAATAGIGEEVDEGEEALFSLSQVRGAKGLAAAGAAPNCTRAPARARVERRWNPHECPRDGHRASFAAHMHRKPDMFLLCAEVLSTHALIIGEFLSIRTFLAPGFAASRLMWWSRFVERRPCGGDRRWRLAASRRGVWHAGERDVLDSEELRVTLDAGDSGDELVSSDSSGSDDDDGGERAAAKYEAMVETYLDRQYESYLQRKHARDAIKAEKQRRARLGDAGIGDGATPFPPFPRSLPAAFVNLL